MAFMYSKSPSPAMSSRQSSCAMRSPGEAPSASLSASSHRYAPSSVTSVSASSPLPSVRCRELVTATHMRPSTGQSAWYSYWNASPSSSGAG